MSDVKWLKISTDVFNNSKIKIIEAMPEGDALIVIWFKILMLAGDTNDNGMVYFAKNLPFNEITLSTVLNKPISTIKLALSTFEQFGMIEIVNDFIHISNWEKYQNINGLEKIREQTRLRVAKHRETKKIECNVTGNVTVTGGNETDIDIDIEKEIEKEKDNKEKEIPKGISKKKPPKEKYGEYQNVLLTDIEYNRLCDDYSQETIHKAIKFLDEYIEEKGYKSKSHNLAIRRWVIDAINKKNNNNKSGGFFEKLEDA